MNRFISFALGAVCMLAVVLTINLFTSNNQVADVNVNSNIGSEVAAKPKQSEKVIDKQIAYVNNDLGIEGTNVNVASSLIDNMVIGNGYKIETTTYNDATEGLKDDKYVAYVVFGADYSSSLFSITHDQLPTKAKINIRVNGNLSDEQETEVAKVLFQEQNYIHSTISYIYITYLLDAIHSSQNSIETVIENEQYMNSVASSVATYATEKRNSFKDYLENSEKTEIELETSSIEDLYEKNLQQLTAVNKLDVEGIKTNLETGQESFMTSISNAMLSEDMEVNKLDLTLPNISPDNTEELELAINDLLVSNTQGIIDTTSTVQGIGEQLAGFEDIGTLPTLSDVKIFDVLEIIWTTVKDEEADYSAINDLNSDPEYASVIDPINMFIVSYANWYTTAYHITPETCKYDCFDEFNNKYSDEFGTWENLYSQLTGVYGSVANFINNNLLTVVESIQTSLNNYANSLIDSEGLNPDTDYVTEITIPDKTPQENYTRLNQYCRMHPNPSSAVGKFGCTIQGVAKAYTDYMSANISYNTELNEAQNKIEQFNTSNEEAINNQNQQVSTANENITNQMTSKNTSTVTSVVTYGNQINTKLEELKTSINERVTNVNEGKDQFATSVIEMLEGYQEQLNTSIASAQETLYNDRKDLSDAAGEYNNSYGKASTYYGSNIGSLTSFTSILANTRDGAEGNLYLYDFFVNPLEFAVQIGSKSKDAIETNLESEAKSTVNDSGKEDKDRTLGLPILLGTLVVLCGLAFVLLRTGDGDDE